MLDGAGGREAGRRAEPGLRWSDVVTSRQLGPPVHGKEDLPHLPPRAGRGVRCLGGGRVGRWEPAGWQILACRCRGWCDARRGEGGKRCRHGMRPAVQRRAEAVRHPDEGRGRVDAAKRPRPLEHTQPRQALAERVRAGGLGGGGVPGAGSAHPLAARSLGGGGRRGDRAVAPPPPGRERGGQEDALVVDARAATSSDRGRPQRKRHPLATSTKRRLPIPGLVDLPPPKKNRPREGWLVTGHPSGFCDGTSNSVCGRQKSSNCLMSGHNNGRGGMEVDALSGWLVLQLADVTQRLFMARGVSAIIAMQKRDGACPART